MSPLALMLVAVLTGGAASARTSTVAERVKERVAELARAALDMPEAEVEVDEVELPDGAWLRIEVSAIASKGRPLGWVTVRAKGATRSEERELWLKAHVIARVPTLVASHPLERGQLIAAGDVHVEPRPFAEDALGSALPAIGALVRLAYARGEALSLRGLTRPTLIRRGAHVVALVADPRFTLRAPAEALEDGALGDAIAVRVLLGKKVVRGVVRDADTVEVP